MATTILVLGLLVFFGHFLAGLFERTKVPDVLILILAGILLGPVFDVVAPADFGKVGPVFTTLALIIILFEGGIHLSVRALGAAAVDTLTVSLASMAITTLLVALLADALLPLDFTSSLFVGAALGGTSSAVVVPMIRTLKLNPVPGTVLFLESAATDILVIVLALALLQMMTIQAGAAQAAVAGAGAGALLGQIGLSFLVAGLVGVAGAVVWSAVLNRVRQIPNTVFTTLAYVFILFGLTEMWGYSGAIAAMTFGIAAANLPAIPERIVGQIFAFKLAAFDQQERAFFGEAVFLVKTFFFVYLGVSITFADWGAVLSGLALGLVAYPQRAVVIRMLASPATTSRRDAALMTALVPKGLAPAVMAGLPLQAGLPGGEAIQGATYAAVFFSIVACAILVFAIERGMAGRLAGPWLRKFSEEIPAAPAPAQETAAAPEPAPAANVSAPPPPSAPGG